MIDETLGVGRMLTILAAALLLMTAPGWAQLGKSFRTAPKLTSTDIAMVRKLVREDLTGKPKGTTLSWSNPDSTNSGTVTLLNTFTSQGRDCRRVRYTVKPGVKQPADVKPATYGLTSCRLADGSWKVDNNAKPDQP